MKPTQTKHYYKGNHSKVNIHSSIKFEPLPQKNWVPFHDNWTFGWIYIYIYYNMKIVYVNLDGYIKLMLSWVFFTFSFKTCVFLYVLEVCIPLLDHHHRAMHLRAAAARFKCCKARREDKAWPNCINAGLSWWDVDDALGMEILGFLRFCFL